MSKLNDLRMKNIRHKYYPKGEHKSLLGHTVHMDMQWVEDNKIQSKHIIMTQKDLFIQALKKLEYYNSKK